MSAAPAQASREKTQTLSVTSDLGLTITASNTGSDTSYSFSSVAEIRVEENYITEKQAKAGPGLAAPAASGLKGKVYDYYVQSTSQSVSKERSRPYLHPGIAPLHSSEKAPKELQGFETWLGTRRSHAAAPDSETPDHGRASVPLADLATSPVPPPPAGSSAVSHGGGTGTSTGPSFGRKDSVLCIAENPDLQVRMDSFRVPTSPGRTTVASTPPESTHRAAPQPQPQLELVAGASFFQMPPALEPTPDVHLDLGNCYEVLCMAKAQKLGHLQEAAYKVMSDNYLQVLRNPSIYGCLNASERELILQRRMKGKKCVAVADISTQEPGLHASRLCYYDDGGDRWHHLCHVPPEAVSRGCAMCSMFNYLFVVAGCEGLGRTQKPSNRVFCYNPLTNIWREICPLNQARPHCKLVALDGCLYAIGGECLYTVERNTGSDTSYSFSSVAEIRVEENYITEKQAKAGPGLAAPAASGLKGKVYDYYVQSTSQSVSKERSRPYLHPGIAPLHSSEKVPKELQGFETWLGTRRSHAAAPDSETPDHGRASVPLADLATSPVPPLPAGSSAVSHGGGTGTSTGPSFGRKDSVLCIAENPDLQVRMDSFRVPTSPGRTTVASTPPESTHRAAPQPQPQLELVAGASFFQMPPALEPTPDVHLDLGNCYEVLCMAKAQKLGHLQEAAYKVMSDNYLQVLRNPSIYGCLNASERELILQRRMKGKKCVAVADISTQEPGLHASRLCYYDDGGDRWHHLCHVPPEAVSRGCAMCSMFNYLFVVAGCEGLGRTQKPSNRVFCYNPLTNIWREICPLNQARPHCKLVALDGCLYAIGGECLYTVERYDPRQDRWAFAAPLPNDTFAVAHTATACDGEIYVTGGTLRYLLLRYAARSDSWTVGLAGGSKDRTAEMVTANGFIYRFDLNRSMGIGVYRCSAKAKLWYECATYAMPYPACFQCAAVGSLVHCVGRHFHLRFLADNVSPRFGAKALQPFPAPRGSLLPAVLVLPQAGRVQTPV
nr:PREDICTED: kelch domain-containing protein 7A [Apteryx mantelli mantelli]